MRATGVLLRGLGWEPGALVGVAPSVLLEATSQGGVMGLNLGLGLVSVAISGCQLVLIDGLRKGVTTLHDGLHPSLLLQERHQVLRHGRRFSKLNSRHPHDVKGRLAHMVPNLCR